ncbi:MAG: TraR/DksA C4-type zinc finger protein [Deltaproteobacteria bacterium]|nr:TraR/DksA C4-type zinc finger protein [Deltaproteobacteria bacterium]
MDEYESCESCGRDIFLKRLKALSFTKLCARCAKTEEASRSKGMCPEKEPRTI